MNLRWRVYEDSTKRTSLYYSNTFTNSITFSNRNCLISSGTFRNSVFQTYCGFRSGFNPFSCIAFRLVCALEFGTISLFMELAICSKLSSQFSNLLSMIFCNWTSQELMTTSNLSRRMTYSQVEVRWKRRFYLHLNWSYRKASKSN